MEKNRRFYTKTLEKNAKALKLKKDEVEDLEFGFALTRQGWDYMFFTKRAWKHINSPHLRFGMGIG